jgi:chemosensory pili system protein ChpC
VSSTAELYSLLIPLAKDRLLVPRICVAEVIAFTEGLGETEDDGPEWLAGEVDWNGRRLPVMTLDDPADLPETDRRNRRRIVVFHGLTDAMKGRYYGIVTQGFPQLVRVNPDVLSTDPDATVPEGKPFLCRARMIHEYPLIPDVERIESLVAEQRPG